MIRRLAGLLMCSLAALAMADEVVTTAGETIRGRVVAHDAAGVTIARNVSGIEVRQKVSASEIARITRDVPPQGPTYCEIPVIGTVGREITAESLSRAFDAGRAAGASCYVLLIDSPGGYVDELQRIVEVLARYRDLNTIAFVKNAHSAAAIVAAGCRCVVMYPVGQCGSAVPLKLQENGSTSAAEEKYRSVVRAIGRTAAAIHGRDSALLMAMIDTEGELYFSGNSESPHFSTDKVEGWKRIKDNGKVITMTAGEAVSYGFAARICRTMREVGESQGLPQWSSCGDDARRVIDGHVSSQQARAAAASPSASDQPAPTTPVEAALVKTIAAHRQTLARVERELRLLDEVYKSDSQKLGENTQLQQKLAAEYKRMRAELENARDRLQQAIGDDERHLRANR